jgi:hypothetical protein
LKCPNISKYIEKFPSAITSQPSAESSTAKLKNTDQSEVLPEKSEQPPRFHSIVETGLIIKSSTISNFGMKEQFFQRRILISNSKGSSVGENITGCSAIASQPSTPPQASRFVRRTLTEFKGFQPSDNSSQLGVHSRVKIGISRAVDGTINAPKCNRPLSDVASTAVGSVPVLMESKISLTEKIKSITLKSTRKFLGHFLAKHESQKAISVPEVNEATMTLTEKYFSVENVQSGVEESKVSDNPKPLMIFNTDKPSVIPQTFSERLVNWTYTTRPEIKLRFVLFIRIVSLFIYILFAPRCQRSTRRFYT